MRAGLDPDTIRFGPGMLIPVVGPLDFGFDWIEFEWPPRAPFWTIASYTAESAQEAV